MLDTPLPDKFDTEIEAIKWMAINLRANINAKGTIEMACRQLRHWSKQYPEAARLVQSWSTIEKAPANLPKPLTPAQKLANFCLDAYDREFDSRVRAVRKASEIQGDTLAKFVFLEAMEADGDLDECRSMLESAWVQIRDVCNALEKLSYEKPQE